MDRYYTRTVVLIDDDQVEYNAITHEKDFNGYKNNTIQAYCLVPKKKKKAHWKDNPDDTHVPIHCYQYRPTPFAISCHELHLN